MKPRGYHHRCKGRKGEKLAINPRYGYRRELSLAIIKDKVRILATTDMLLVAEVYIR
jgi:hypothetical protein